MAETSLPSGMYVEEGIGFEDQIPIINTLFLNINVTAITNADITPNSLVAYDVLTAATITADQMAANSIVSGAIAANTIAADHIMADAVTTTKLESGSVTTDKLAAEAVTTSRIYTGAVTAEKMTVDTLSAISAALGEVTSGIVTAATMRTSADPGDNRVIIDSAGLRGYDTSLGLTFRLPTDGSAPLFSSGTIQNATIIDTTIVSDDFKSSSELPWVEFNDSGVAYRETEAVGKYGSGVEYGDGTLYGVGVTGYYGNSSRPLLSVEAERTLADIRLYNRSSEPSGAAQIGDLCVVSGKLMICTTAGTPGSWVCVGDQTA
jgi:hypothetical protein